MSPPLSRHHEPRQKLDPLRCSHEKVEEKNGRQEKLTDEKPHPDLELHIGERYVYQLAKQGFPRVSPGRYNIPKCFRWYVRYLQRKLVERAHPDDENGKGSIAGAAAGEMRHKLLSIETEMKMIELAEKREQLVSIDRVTKDLEAIVVEIRTRILALPPRIAAAVLGETDLAVSQVKIERSLKGALGVLSQFDPDAVEPSSSTRSRT